MRTQQQNHTSLVNFTEKVTHFFTKGSVILTSKAQVDFFMKHMSMFNLNVRVWAFDGFDIDIEPDWRAGVCVGRMGSSEEGWLVACPSLNRDDIENRIPFDVINGFAEHKIVGGVVTNDFIEVEED